MNLQKQSALIPKLIANQDIFIYYWKIIQKVSESMFNKYYRIGSYFITYDISMSHIQSKKLCYSIIQIPHSFKDIGNHNIPTDVILQGIFTVLLHLSQNQKTFIHLRHLNLCENDVATLNIYFLLINKIKKI